MRKILICAATVMAIARVGTLVAQTVPPDSMETRRDTSAVHVDPSYAPVDTTLKMIPDQPKVGQADALAQVVGLEEKRRKAMVAADVKTLTEIIAPDATYVHSTGIMQVRDELLRLLANKTIVYKSFDTEKTAYRVYGTTIVGTGVQSITVMAGGKSRVIHSRYTVVYAERDGAEKLITYQSTPLPEMTPSARPK